MPQSPNIEVLTNFTGLADSKFSGAEGSVAEIVGLDIRTTPGLVKVQQKMARISDLTSPSASISPSASSSPSSSQSNSPSSSASPSASASPSSSSSPSLSPSSSASPSASASGSPSASASPSSSSSPSASISASSVSSDQVDSFIKVAVDASNDYHFWFSSTTGKIWVVDTDGSVYLCYTTVADTGASGALGAIEYNGYIYWATQNKLHRIAIADADTQWTNVEHNWATFDIGDEDYHPMAIQGSISGRELFIGDGYQVASVDLDGTFNSAALDTIEKEHRIRCMIDYENDVLLGTIIDGNVVKSRIFRWDTVSTTVTGSDTIEEYGINAFIRNDNYIMASAGRAGNIYYYNGETLEPYKRIPGNYSNTETAEVNPNAVANFNGVPIFGYSNVSGNPTNFGIYSMGKYSRDYRDSLTLDWPISEGVMEGVEVGAILVVDGRIYASWQLGSEFGIDRLDMSSKYTSAYFITRMLFEGSRNKLDTLKQVSAYYNSLPSGTGFTFSYKKNNGSFVAMTDRVNAKLNEVRSQLSVPEFGSLEIKCAFDVSSNDAPDLEMFTVEKE